MIYKMKAITRVFLTVSRNVSMILLMGEVTVNLMTPFIAPHVKVFNLSNVAGAASAEKVKKEAGEAVEAATEFTNEKRDHFAKRMKSNIAEIDREISELKAEAQKSSAEASEAARAKIEALQTKRDELNAQYRAFEKSTDKAWTKMKTGIDKAWKELRSAYDSAKSEISPAAKK